MGDPRSSGEVLKNGSKLKTVTYAYATTGGEPLEVGVVPARAMAFYFDRDQLVGQEFISSFKADNTNFDDGKIAAIEKGKTTRSDILQFFGKSTASYVKPMVKETSGEAVGYTYQTTRGSVFSGFKFFRKTLLIAFDDADKVLEIDYSSSGSK
jgi:hypothetical protein